MRHVHVDDIVRPQVYLRGAARAFQHHHVAVGGQFRVSPANAIPQRALAPVVVLRLHEGQRPPQHDHVGAVLRGRFQKNGIHAHIGKASAGQRLHDLRPAHFAAVRGDKGIEGHVLGLERSHAQPPSRQQAAEGGGQQTLSGIGAGALHHECRRQGRGKGRRVFHGEKRSRAAEARHLQVLRGLAKLKGLKETHRRETSPVCTGSPLRPQARRGPPATSRGKIQEKKIED